MESPGVVAPGPFSNQKPACLAVLRFLFFPSREGWLHAITLKGTVKLLKRNRVCILR
jgi:hypothetical protein